jgi:hypothetical protein
VAPRVRSIRSFPRDLPQSVRAKRRLGPGIQSIACWLPRAWFGFLQATNHALGDACRDFSSATSVLYLSLIEFSGEPLYLLMAWLPLNKGEREGVPLLS